MVFLTKKRNRYKTKSKKSKSRVRKTKSINKKIMQGGSQNLSGGAPVELYEVPKSMRSHQIVDYSFTNPNTSSGYATLGSTGYAEVEPIGSTLSRTLNRTLNRSSNYEKFYTLNPKYTSTSPYTTLLSSSNKSENYISVNSNPDPDTGYMRIKHPLFHGTPSPNIKEKIFNLRRIKKNRESKSYKNTKLSLM